MSPELSAKPIQQAQVEAGPTSNPGRVAEIQHASEEPGSPGGARRPSTVEVTPADPYKTVAPSWSEDRSTVLESGSPRDDWPKVPGYQIIRRLGEGGMGVVYEARQLGLNRRVALKMIVGGLQARPDLVSRFRIEAEAVARLRHPNIVQIFDIGEADGLPFVSLELLDGGRLADRLKGTPLPGIASAELVATLALAIGAAHQAGIVHRDLKPSNVLFAADGTPKITDFGLAKRIDSQNGQTETGQVLGTPSYMAPEQARGHVHGIGPAADVYALGAILYEMLTGRPPFKGETPIDTIRQVIEDDPLAPSRLAPRVTRDLDTICLKCLHKDSARRYASALALADDLTRYCNGEPIHARPTLFWERAAKWSRRHPLRAAASILVVLACFGLIASYVDHQRKLFARQMSGLNLLQKAESAQSPAELEGAQRELSEFVPSVKDEKQLKWLFVRVTDKRQKISDRLNDLQAQQAKQNRLQKFRELRNAAQLYAWRFLFVDSSEQLQTVRATVLAALTLYGQKPEPDASAWSLAQPLEGALDAAERAEVRDGCHDLLLILAEAEDPAEGLKILDKAVRLTPAPTLGYHLLRATCCAATKDSAGAAHEQELARKLTPKSAFDHLLYGRVQYARAQQLGHGELALSQVGEAIHSSQAAIRLDPNQLGAHLLLAVVYFNAQRFSEAKTNLDTCIRATPGLPGLYLFRALLYGEEGARARTRIREAPARAAEWRLEAAEAFAAAEEDYGRALELRLGDELRYVLLVNRGGMYLRADRLDQAIADVEAAVKLRPRLYHAHALLAQIKEQQGRLEDAAEALDRAIDRQRDRPELYRARAMLIVRLHDEGKSKSQEIAPARRARAIRDLEQSIRLEANESPQKADDYAEVGRLLFASGKSQEALDAYDRALRIVPDNLKALRLRAAALLDLDRYEEVFATCTAYLKQGTPSADLLEIRGQARLAREELDGAISDLTTALSLTPHSAALHNHRGWAYLLADASKLALADFDDAIRLDPSLGHAYSGRGLAGVGPGHWRDAVADVETAIRLASRAQKQRAYFNAARVYALAMQYSTQEVSTQGEVDLALYHRLRDRAGALLHQSVDELPPQQRARFWRDAVASDPVLRQFQASSH